MGRAARRYHERRMKRHARWVWERVWGNKPNERWIVRHWKHMQRCSCWMCGNQRRHAGEVTRQEKIVALRLREEVFDLLEAA